MPSPKRRLAHSLAALLGLVLIVPLAGPALAQTAPVIGDHYAARASDTGYGGAVNASGGYGASVPLDLPGAKGGLPVPLQVVHGGNGFGAAGLGWDVPLSFIRLIRDINGAINKNMAHYRPVSAGNADPVARDQFSLTLDGSRIDLVRNPEDTAWVGLRGGQQLEVRDVGGGVLELYDGNGRKYSFSSDGGNTGPLDAGNFYLLRDIFGPGGSNVHLNYTFGAPSLGGGSAGLSIDLTSLIYNWNGAGDCPKHRVNLVYDADAPTPLSISMLGSTALIRQHKLLAVDVMSMPSILHPDGGCSSNDKMTSLRTYNFTYQNDADIGQPRLHQVTMIGQEDTDERNVTLPVATYSYGQFTGSDGKISYRGTQHIDLPTDFTTAVETSGNMAGVSATGTAGGRTDTLKGLFDIDGDGRPDLVYGYVNNDGQDIFTTTGGRLWRNTSGAFGVTMVDAGFLNPPPPPPPGQLAVPLPFIGGLQTNSVVPGTDSHGHPDVGKTVQNTVSTQFIDMNGDGRLDIVISNGPEEARHNWLVYLNTPDPSSPNGISWQLRTISTAPIVDHLIEAGLLSATDSTLRDFVPLSRSFTSKTVHVQSDNVVVEEEGETTFVEWRLQDINGDGYPDVVYNGSPIMATLQNGTLWKPDFTGSRAVLALMNVAGVHLDNTGTNAFSAPVVLEADNPSGCGIEKWAPGFANGALGRSNQVCGLEDVNGDGLVDRVRASLEPSGLIGRVQLGTGNLNAPFAGPKIVLPGPVAVSKRDLVATIDATGTHYNAPASVCPTGDITANYPVQRIVGLRDLNGDGFPDYIVGPGVLSSSTHWNVFFGTGAGFVTTPVAVDDFGLELSLEKVSCQGRGANGTTAVTTAGLYDIDGDGQPEVVAFNGNSNTLDVSQSQGKTAASSAAGQLVKIDYGYGASTNITYGSAKQDVLTPHLLPYPEIVVRSVTTTDASNNPLTSPVNYAYGGASQYFDAAYDRWVFPGYQRRVSLQNSGDPSAPTNGIARITDNYPLAAFDPNSDGPTRFQRYLKTGRTSDVTTLSGDLGDTDASTLLATDITSDSRRIAATRLDYSVRLLQPGSSVFSQFCVDMVYPYDYGQSFAYRNDPTHQSFDQCAERGFALQTSVTSWRGTPGTTAGTAEVIVSPQIVKTGSVVTAFDDYGRVTASTDRGDLADDNNVPNDNLCVHVDYAAPQTTPVRVLNAVAVQTVTGCGDNAPILAQKRFEYDNLPRTTDPTTGQLVAQVSTGNVTSSTVTRYDMDSHLPLGDDIRLFDATYDATGNLQTVTKTRDDGATATNTIGYDPFGLVATSVTSTALDPIAGPLPALTTSITPDPVTLQIKSTTDPNKMVRSMSYDGFGRALLSKVASPGGSEGVLSKMTYRGFELVDTNGDGIPDTSEALTLGAERSVVQKVFTDAVPVGTEDTAPGRFSTAFLDSLGRATKTKVLLGSDYQNKSVVIGRRTYDALGRISFMADPFLSVEDPFIPTLDDALDNAVFATAYGTTYNYNTDGTPNCFTRGSGVQPASAAIDETNEVFPTCFNRSFLNNQEILERQDADAFADNSPQLGIARQTIRNATGRALEGRTVRHARHGRRDTLEDVMFFYDALGHMSSMKRFQDPANQAGPATTTWHFDSLGWMTKLEEDGVAPQTRTFDNWGKVTQTQWCDDPSACPATDRRTITRFDAFGRMTHSEDLAGGQTVPGTVNDYTYDFNGGAIVFVPRNNTLGRLASATWSTGQEWFTYDDFGRVNGRTFIDTTVTPNAHHYEIHERHDDGSEKTLHLQLHDTNGNDERVNYAYDSAGRVTSVVYNNGVSSQNLFAASGSNPIYDVFGRITAAQYGLSSFNATYAASRRQLLIDATVTSPDGKHSRKISFPPLNGVTAYDPVGRERQRLELIDGLGQNSRPPVALLRGYDGLGRLSTSQNLQMSTNTVQPDRAFTYDSLGNILTQADATTVNPNSVALSYRTEDKDRICNIAYAASNTPPTAATPPAPCLVAYDGAGNIVSEPTNPASVPGTSGIRTFEYFPSGAVRTIKDGGTNATFAYDAFGGLQQLTVNTTGTDPRADNYFGRFIKQRTENSRSVINRRIPAPGLTATRHGPTGGWTFEFGEARGTRFTTDQYGAFLQDIDYRPFGEVSFAHGAAPGSAFYTSEQWNGGDLLKGLGVVKLGARVYDPGIGRFLSRDPLLNPRTAAATNPYAFAENDPINKSDPTGLYTSPSRADSDVIMANNSGLANLSTIRPEDLGDVEPPIPPDAPPADVPGSSDGPPTVLPGGLTTVPGGNRDNLLAQVAGRPNPSSANNSSPGAGGGPSPTSGQSTGLALPTLYTGDHDYDWGDVQQRTDLALSFVRDYEDQAREAERKIKQELQAADIMNDALAEMVANNLRLKDRYSKESNAWRNVAVLNIIDEVTALTGARADVESVTFAVGQILDRQPIRIFDRYPRADALEAAKMAYPQLAPYFPRR